MRGEGGGKRWMKCRGNEEIKIAIGKYRGKEDTAKKKQKNPPSF